MKFKRENKVAVFFLQSDGEGGKIRLFSLPDPSNQEIQTEGEVSQEG